MGLDKSASVYECFPFIWRYNDYRRSRGIRTQPRVTGKVAASTHMDANTVT